MTTVAPAPRIEWTPPPNRRRLIIRGLAILVALALVGGGIGWLVYIHTYQPLSLAGYYPGPGPNAAPITDGIRRTGYIATGPVGSVSRIRTTISNYGHFDVRLLGLPPDETGPSRITIKWMPLGNGDWGVALERPDSEWKTGPITLPAGDTMGVAIDVTRPKCGRGVGYSMDWLSIRWSALGVHHIYKLPFGESDNDVPFYSCYSRSALKHIEPRFAS